MTRYGSPAPALLRRTSPPPAVLGSANDSRCELGHSLARRAVLSSFCERRGDSPALTERRKRVLRQTVRIAVWRPTPDASTPLWARSEWHRHAPGFSTVGTDASRSRPAGRQSGILASESQSSSTVGGARSGDLPSGCGRALAAGRQSAGNRRDHRSAQDDVAGPLDRSTRVKEARRPRHHRAPGNIGYQSGSNTSRSWGCAAAVESPDRTGPRAPDQAGLRRISARRVATVGWQRVSGSRGHSADAGRSGERSLSPRKRPRANDTGAARDRRRARSGAPVPIAR